MFEDLKYNPQEFASAYIQTLPHADKIDKFNNRVDYQEYLDERRQHYFHQYLEAIEFANSFSKSSDTSDE